MKVRVAAAGVKLGESVNVGVEERGGAKVGVAVRDERAIEGSRGLRAGRRAHDRTPTMRIAKRGLSFILRASVDRFIPMKYAPEGAVVGPRFAWNVAHFGTSDSSKNRRKAWFLG